MEICEWKKNLKKKTYKSHISAKPVQIMKNYRSKMQLKSSWNGEQAREKEEKKKCHKHSQRKTTYHTKLNELWTKMQRRHEERIKNHTN